MGKRVRTNFVLSFLEIFDIIFSNCSFRLSALRTVVYNASVTDTTERCICIASLPALITVTHCLVLQSVNVHSRVCKSAIVSSCTLFLRELHVQSCRKPGLLCRIYTSTQNTEIMQRDFSLSAYFSTRE